MISVRKMSIWGTIHGNFGDINALYTHYCYYYYYYYYYYYWVRPCSFHLEHNRHTLQNSVICTPHSSYGLLDVREDSSCKCASYEKVTTMQLKLGTHYPCPWVVDTPTRLSKMTFTGRVGHQCIQHGPWTRVSFCVHGPWTGVISTVPSLTIVGEGWLTTYLLTKYYC